MQRRLRLLQGRLADHGLSDELLRLHLGLRGSSTDRSTRRADRVSSVAFFGGRILLWLLVFTAALLATAVLAVRRLLVLVTVQYDSLAPLLNDGDRVLALRRWPARWLRRGDLVLVWPWPDHAKDGPPPFGVVPFIKRVEGLPGDTMTVWLRELDPVHRERHRAAFDAEGKRVWKVPPGHFFAKGTQEVSGFDSRTWGPVPDRGLLGWVVMKLPR